MKRKYSHKTGASVGNWCINWNYQLEISEKKSEIVYTLSNQYGRQFKLGIGNFDELLEFFKVSCIPLRKIYLNEVFIVDRRIVEILECTKCSRIQFLPPYDVQGKNKLFYVYSDRHDEAFEMIYGPIPPTCYSLSTKFDIEVEIIAYIPGACPEKKYNKYSLVSENQDPDIYSLVVYDNVAIIVLNL
jgi:hypothetical protein